MPGEPDRAARCRQARHRGPRLGARRRESIWLELGPIQFGAGLIRMRHGRAQRVGVDILRGPINDRLGNLLAVQVDIRRPGRRGAGTLAARQRGTIRTAVARRSRNAVRVAAGAAIRGVARVAAVVGGGAA